MPIFSCTVIRGHNSLHTVYVSMISQLKHSLTTYWAYWLNFSYFFRLTIIFLKKLVKLAFWEVTIYKEVSVPWFKPIQMVFDKSMPKQSSDFNLSYKTNVNFITILDLKLWVELSIGNRGLTKTI